MILNAYAVLDGFTSLVRLLLGLWVLGLGLPVWWHWQASAPPERRGWLEDRAYLLFVLATALLVLNVVSWPLFYLLLQSYVPEWPGVMCIYGVTQVGTGSIGPSRFLPSLLTILQALKPALVFVSGAWFVLYGLNRRTATAPLMPRVLAAVLVLGLLAVLDASVEDAYLLIPKKEEFLSAGCCTQAFDADTRTSYQVLARLVPGEDSARWLTGAYYATNLGMCLALAGYLLRPRWRQGAGLAPLAIGALVSLPVSLVFLIEVAAPTLLGLPHHHCPYDLLPDVPESVPAIGLYVVGLFAVGWACVACWFGRGPETAPFLDRQVGKLLSLALFGYAVSVAMLSVELALAS